MQRGKLTKRIIDQATPRDRAYVVWDGELKGFCCKITPLGRKVYCLYYRTRDGRQRRPAIGLHGAVTCDQARDIAREWLAEVAKGGDPSGVRQRQRKAITVAEPAERYMIEHARVHRNLRAFSRTVA